MGRSKKEYERPIKRSTLGPIIGNQGGPDQGAGPDIGHGEPLPQDQERENTGQGVVLNEWPEDERKSGEGPDDDRLPEGGTNAKP